MKGIKDEERYGKSDLFRQNLTPYYSREIEIIKKATGN